MSSSEKTVVNLAAFRFPKGQLAVGAFFAIVQNVDSLGDLVVVVAKQCSQPRGSEALFLQLVKVFVAASSEYGKRIKAGDKVVLRDRRWKDCGYYASLVRILG